MRIKNIPKYKYLYATTDIFVLIFSYLLSVYLVDIPTRINIGKHDFGTFINFSRIISISILFLYIFHANQLYTRTIIVTRKNQVIRILKSVIIGLCFLLLFTFIFYLILHIKFFLITSTILILSSFVFLSSTLLYLFRIEILGKLYHKLKHRYFQKKVIIVGGGPTGKYLASKFAANNTLGLEMIGFIDDDLDNSTEIFDGIRVIGR